MKSIHLFILLALLICPHSSPGKTEPQKQPVSVKNLTCQQYASLPDDVRPLVAGWVRGFYYRESWKDTWLLDVDRARTAFTALNEACKQSPAASFRYKLGEVVKQIEVAKKSSP